MGRVIFLSYSRLDGVKCLEAYNIHLEPNHKKEHESEVTWKKFSVLSKSCIYTL